MASRTIRPPPPVRLGSLKYTAIKAALDQMLERYRGGDNKLPSERDLARTFQCNALTVRKAMALLVEEGKVVRTIGSGTFVAPVAAATGVRAPGAAAALGMLSHTECDAYSLKITQMLVKAAAARGCGLRSEWVGDLADPQGLRAAIRCAESLAGAGCRALVLPWIPQAQIPQLGELLRGSPVPVVVPYLVPGLERFCFETPSAFGTATMRATEAACRYFRLRGQRRIALLGPADQNIVMMQRNLGAYTAYACREGLDQLCGLVGAGAEAMDDQARRWQKHRGALAVICYDDSHAFRFMTAMHKLGWAAPRDYAILGYNDSDEARATDPPLSSMAPRFEDVARSLIDSALALGDGATKQSATGPGMYLAVRRSCGGSEGMPAAMAATLREQGVEMRYDPGTKTVQA